MEQAIRAVVALLAAVAAMYMSMSDAAAQQRRGEAARPPAQAEPRPAAQQAASQMKIEKWWFEWTVVEMGEMDLGVVRTNDRSFVRLKNGFHSLRLTGTEAEQVGAVLAETDAMSAKLRGPESKRESRAAGEFTVTFSQDEKSGFWVSISGSGIMPDSVGLRREQALAVAPHMQQARAMLAVVAERVRP